jgi:hypothetical protein
LHLFFISQIRLKKADQAKQLMGDHAACFGEPAGPGWSRSGACLCHGTENGTNALLVFREGAGADEHCPSMDREPSRLAATSLFD